MFVAIKLVVTALLIVLISEISKRSSLAGAILAAMPLVSILAMTWMYIDTKETSAAVAFSQNIVWLIVPSMTLFIVFPLMIKRGFEFFTSMGVAIFMTFLAYYGVLFVVEKLGLRA
jgi:hypothetical protein